MAINWMESFEPYLVGSADDSGMQDGLWTVAGVSHNITDSQARTGSQSLQVGRQVVSEASRRAYSTPVSIAGAGVGVFFEGFNVNHRQVPIAFWDSGGNEVVSIRTDSIGRLLVHGGRVLDPVQLNTLSPVLTPGTWSHIEAKVTVGEEGSIEIRVNNAVVLSGTVDTTVDGAGDIAQFAAYQRTQIGSAAENDFYIDDVVAWDTIGPLNNDFLGDRRVYTVYPITESTPADWTVDGTAADAVDAVAGAVDDDTFLSTDTVDDVHQFNLEELPEEVVGVDAVQVFSRAQKDDAGTCEIQLGVVDSGWGVSDGPSRAVGTNFVYYTDVLNETPFGPWTRETIDGLQVRITRSA